MVLSTGGDKIRGRLLFLGDLHLGRRPMVAVPDSGPELGPGTAFTSCVELALAERVAAVVLAGDVVESLEDRFEADGILGPGLRRLHERGIVTLAVAGNHDVRALPRLAARHARHGFRILGADGAFEAVRVGPPEAPVCSVVGRSFRDLHEAGNPLDPLTQDVLDPELPNLGVLHCDVDSGDPRYAPVARVDFDRGAAGAVAAWFLGHVHVPDHGGLAAERPVGYLGSVVGLDAGEPGARGPWLVEISAAGGVRARQRVVGPVRFERFAVERETLPTGEADLEDALVASVDDAFGAVHAALAGERVALHAVDVRVEIRCRHAMPSMLRTAARRVGLVQRSLGVGDELVHYVCGDLGFAVEPAYDLERLARERSGIGALARILENLGAAPEELVAALDRRTQEATVGRGWPELPADRGLDLADLLRQEAGALLGDLCRVRDGEAGA